MEKISDIIESIANEKNLKLDAVRDRVITALTNTAKKIYGEQYEFYVEPKSLQLFQKILIVADEDERLSEENEHYIALSKAQEQAEGVEVGDELTYEVQLENSGRTAFSIFNKELEYHIQQLLEETVFEKYQKMVGQVVFGTAVRVDSEDNTFVEIDEIRAFLPRKNRIKGEKFKVGEVVKAIIRRVYSDRNGIRMELTRTSPKFLIALLEAEVPEIKDGYVEVVAAARIPGERAKIVLKSHNANVDAVGATVGQKGVRINAVSKELHNENIDCIDFCEEPALLITRALAPAIINSVKIELIKPENTDFDANEALSAALKSSKNLSENAAENAENSAENLGENLNSKGGNSAASANLSENSAQNLNSKGKNSAAAENLGENLNLKSENSPKNSKEKAKAKSPEQPTKKAIVTLNVEQKSKAIGKNGINIRLASMLTGYEIELKELGEKVMSNEEAMKSLQSLFKE